MAQLVEHILGKDEVPSSNLGSSSRHPRGYDLGALVFYRDYAPRFSRSFGFYRDILPGFLGALVFYKDIYSLGFLGALVFI